MNYFDAYVATFAEGSLRHLLPHTGPTGGGDSKVDAETYPVADALSLVWFTGIGREAAGDRWAFAFSAKKNWRPKVEADIGKVVATNRGYRKVFFVTNQFVSIESALKWKTNSVKSTAWTFEFSTGPGLLDRVFSGKREALAIDELKINARRANGVGNRAPAETGAGNR
jgi:hypothetical protein